jgi:hypothetical protein
VDPWTLGVIAVLVIGLTAIIYGWLHDRARTRKARTEMLSPPDRAIPRFDPEAPAPQYLSELQARRAPVDAVLPALPEVEREALAASIRTQEAVRIEAGYAKPTFVTDAASKWAVLNDPTILVCAEPVTSIRELLPIMELALLAQRSLVIAAPSFTADVLATLEVNVIQQKLRLVAVVAHQPVLEHIATRTGATLLDRSDLQAGYVPADHLGRAGRWVSDSRQTWLFDPSTSSGHP